MPCLNCYYYSYSNAPLTLWHRNCARTRDRERQKEREKAVCVFWVFVCTRLCVCMIGVSSCVCVWETRPCQWDFVTNRQNIWLQAVMSPGQTSIVSERLGFIRRRWSLTKQIRKLFPPCFVLLLLPLDSRRALQMQTWLVRICLMLVKILAAVCDVSKKTCDELVKPGRTWCSE